MERRLFIYAAISIFFTILRCNSCNFCDYGIRMHPNYKGGDYWMVGIRPHRLLSRAGWKIDSPLGVSYFPIDSRARSVRLKPKSIRSRGANYIRSTRGTRTPLTTTVPAAGNASPRTTHRPDAFTVPSSRRGRERLPAGPRITALWRAPIKRDVEMKSPSTNGAPHLAGYLSIEAGVTIN